MKKTNIRYILELYTNQWNDTGKFEWVSIDDFTNLRIAKKDLIRKRDCLKRKYRLIKEKIILEKIMV